MTCSCGCLDTPQSILDDEEIDVFEQIIPNTEEFYSTKRTILWSYYRYRAIGHSDMNYWLQCMKDRYEMTKGIWDLKFRAFDALMTKTASDIDFSDGSTEYDTVNTNEDLPDNASSAAEYLTDRQRTHYSGKSYGGLETETAAAYIDGVPKIYDDFAREFANMFYFGM